MWSQSEASSMWSQQLLVLLPKLKGRALEVAARSMRTTASPRTLRESMEQLDAVGFTSADVLALARKRPTALTVLATRSPASMLGMLREQLGVADPGALLRAQPTLVTLDAPRVIAAAAFIQRYVGGPDKVGPFVAANPQALLWRDDRKSVVAEHLRLLGVPDRAIRSASDAFPQLSLLTSASNVDRLWTFLHDELRLSPAALGKLVASYPQLLGLSLEANVRPKVSYLAEELGIDVAKALIRHPQLLGLALETNLRVTVEYLRETGVDVRKAVERHPQALSLSLTHSIMPSIEYLRSLGIERVGRLLTAQPTILSLSLAANLEPKVALDDA